MLQLLQIKMKTFLLVHESFVLIPIWLQQNIKRYLHPDNNRNAAKQKGLQKLFLSK